MSKCNETVEREIEIAVTADGTGLVIAAVVAAVVPILVWLVLR